MDFILETKYYEASFWALVSVSMFTLLYGYILCLLLAVTMVYAVWKVLEVKTRKLLAVANKAVLITGCDTGFGHHLAKRLLDLGFRVYAGVLDMDGEGAKSLCFLKSSKLLVVQLDVTKQKDIDKAVKTIGNKGLWGVINNAGIGMNGCVEYVPVEEFIRCAQVNLYGQIRVIQACLPFIRKSQGRIVNVSSVKGLYPWPSNSPYHVTKYGVETVSDCLRLEMMKFGVKVSIIEPGWYDAVTANSSQEMVTVTQRELDSYWDQTNDEVRAAYGRQHIDHIMERRRNSKHGGGKSAKPILDAFEDALLNVDPKHRYLVWGSYTDVASILATICPVLPTRITDKIIAYFSKCDKL